MIWRHEVEHAAARYDVDPRLIEAVVVIESTGHPYAWNPEPRYRWLWNVKTGQPFRALSTAEASAKTPPADFPVLGGDRDQEWWGQQASWGLMQIMGAVARELGFRGLYLPEIVKPEINIDLGTKHLASHLAWANGDVAVALGAYNAGRSGARGTAGQAYAAKVIEALP